MDDPYASPQAANPPRIEQERRDQLFYRRNELRELAWKLAAVFLVVRLVEWVAAFAYVDRNTPAPGLLWVPIVAIAGLAVVCYVNSRSHVDIPAAEQDNAVDGGIAVLLQRVGFSIVGVLVVADSLPQALGAVVSIWRSIGDLRLPGRAMLADVGHLFALAFGLFLFFGANALSRLWLALRHAGNR